MMDTETPPDAEQEDAVLIETLLERNGYGWHHTDSAIRRALLGLEQARRSEAALREQVRVLEEALERLASHPDDLEPWAVARAALAAGKGEG
jgi:hypothetical protein